MDSHNSDNIERPRRKRSATLLNFEWLTERLRRSQTIKDQVDSSTYRVDSKQLARVLLNKEDS